MFVGEDGRGREGPVGGLLVVASIMGDEDPRLLVGPCGGGGICRDTGPGGGGGGPGGGGGGPVGGGDGPGGGGDGLG